MSNVAQKIYLIGADVTKSKSPVIHKSIYEYLGIEFEYLAVSKKDNVEAQMFFAQHIQAAQEVNGFFSSNVTYPYKNLAMDFFAKENSQKNVVVGKFAQLAGGANLVIAPKLQVYNYDGSGCLWFLKSQGYSLAEKRIVVCGTGITAKSIAAAIEDEHPASIVFLSRNADKRCEEFQKWPFSNIRVVSYKDCENEVLKANFLIDATPVGSSLVNPTGCVIRSGLLNGHQVVLDVVYKDTPTALLMEAKQAGCDTYDGLGMLVAQAVFCIKKICEEAKIVPTNPLDFATMYRIGKQAIQE